MYQNLFFQLFTQSSIKEGFAGMKGHHLILGELEDFISGEILEDTLDERYRQKIARILVEEKGYDKKEVIRGNRLFVRAGESSGSIPVDFRVELSGKTGMIIKYGPGSLITRRRPALAISRILMPYPVPIAAVSNGEDADILSVHTSELIASGLQALPHRDELAEIMENADFSPLSEKRAEMESRIVYCYEIDGCCPCDTNICRT